MGTKKGVTTPPPSIRGVVQTKTARLYSLSDHLPALERQAIEGAVSATAALDEVSQEVALNGLDKVVSARVRGVKKARYDRQRRTIIGARVNREFAALCKWAAESQGMSTTQWCRQALQAALTEFPPPREDQTWPDDLEDDPQDGCYLL